MGSTATDKDEMYKSVIGELLELSDKTEPKKVLGAYNYKAVYQTNLQKMKLFSVPILEECAIFLKLKVRNEDATKIYKNKQTLADRIIMKIESHFTEECDECGKEYRNKLNGDEPLLRCYLCMQGSHDCEQITGRFLSSSQETSQLTGTVWLCRGCRVKNDLFGSHKPIKKTAAVSFDNITNEIKDSSGNNVIIDNGETVTDNEEERRPSPRRIRTENNVEDAQPRPTICPLYKKRQCPHGGSGQKEVDGKTCEFPHPRRCTKYCRFGKRKGGCTKDKACKYYHPVLCKFSVRTGKCMNSDCTYTHLKGTKRSENDENGQDQQPPAPRRSTENNFRQGVRPVRHRKDSAVSTGSRGSEGFRTPSHRLRRTSERQNITVATERDNFLEKLLENIKEGFSQQKAEINQIKEGVDRQISVLWKQMNSISVTSLPQVPPFPQFQFPHQPMPAPHAPWNTLPNPCSVY